MSTVVTAPPMTRTSLPESSRAPNKQSAPGDEDALARAMRAEEQSASSDEGDWEWAVRAADKPRPRTKRRLSPRRDRATFDALRALGGDPEDL